MAKLSYFDQLKHPFWQRKRLEMLDAAGWQCQCCDGKETTLHVHHKRYIKGALVWEYDDADLIVLCSDCHADEHAARALLDELLSRSTMLGTVHQVTALVAGYLASSYAVDDELAERAKALGPSKFDLGVFLTGIGLSTWPQLAAFVRQVHDEFEPGPVPLDRPASQAVERWESGAQSPPLSNWGAC